jgi:arginine N-succinyltransferase
MPQFTYTDRNANHPRLTGVSAKESAMFLIRQSIAEDTGTLLKLARMVYFINLPPDERLIASKIQHSRDCFRHAATVADDDDQGDEGDESPDAPAPRRHGITGLAQSQADVFMFTIVDTDSGGVVGTSQIKAHMGGPGNPNYSLKVFSREFRSANLGIGTTHLLARLHADESGPSEIGGLIIQPAYRGHKDKPGRFLSWIRFHLVGMRRALFADKIIAEMAPTVSSDGDNLFWDSIGRKFIPVKYVEADRFCQHNRSFIDQLYPKDDIYLTLLPLEVLNQVGQVGPETVPARKMLERLGFQYRNFIDPFDGGPHLEAATDRIALVRDTKDAVLGDALAATLRATHRGIVSTLRADGEFRAVECEFARDKHDRVCVPGEALDLLEASRGTACAVTPFEKVATKAPSKQSAKPAPKTSAKPAAKAVKKPGRRKVGV